MLARLTTSCRRLCDAATMKEMDRKAIEERGIPGVLLMENAARAVADVVAEAFPHTTAPICVCCGSGNNGGDGYAAARLLANRGYPVTVVCDQEPQTPDARLNADLWRQFGRTLRFPSAEATQAIAQAEVLLDAIFGVGLSRPITGEVAEWIQAINASPAAVVGIDIPSGVSADDSATFGEAVRCTCTVTFQCAKVGLWQHPGHECAGQIFSRDVCIPEAWPASASSTYLVNEAAFRSALPSPPPNSHKGTLGHLMVIGGQAGMGGAPLLAGQAGLSVGTGLVTVGVPHALRDRFLHLPELMTWSAPHVQEQWHPSALTALHEKISLLQAVALGCGLGVSEATNAFVNELVPLCRDTPLLIDADALNVLQPEALSERDQPAVLTPHPKEFSRLTGLAVAEIQTQRVATARAWAQRWNVVLLLKGALTVIAAPTGEVFINPTGNAGMATAGSGDVLSGMIGGLLAQGLEPLVAAVVGAYWHGKAGDWGSERWGKPALTASRIVEGISPSWLATTSAAALEVRGRKETRPTA